MEHAEAVHMMAAIEEINSCLNRAGEVCESIADVELQKKVKWELGQAMSRIYLGLMRPICRQFPELDPDAGVGDDED
jgi:hypothetical protein